MGALILTLLFSFFATADEVSLGENFFDVTKAIGAIDHQAPAYLKTIEGILRQNCTPSKPLKACAFLKVAKAHAQAYVDWRAIAEPQNPFGLSPVVFRPRFTDLDVRAGSWNVQFNDAEKVAQMSALAAVRYLITQIALRKSFDDVAEWFGAWGSGTGSFSAVIRPSVSAFLNSGNALGQMADFGLNMECGSNQVACRAVKVRLGQFLRTQSAQLAPLVSALSFRAGAETVLGEVYARDFAFREYVEVNWRSLWELFSNPEHLRRVPQVSVYVDFLARRAADRKNLMPGRYSMADEVLAMIVLSDLERARRWLEQLPPSDASGLPNLSADSENAIRRLEAEFQKQFKPYREGLTALLAAAGA